MKKPKVVIVMPAYFAEKTVEKTYYAIPKELRINKNIILVDDASRDSTVIVAKKLGLRVIVHEKNLGYGGNQKTCYREALKLHPDVVVMIHPDYQYDPTMTKELIRPLVDGWLDIMLGNRIRSRREALEGGMPRYKYYSNRLLTIIENLTLGLNLGEYHTGFRAYTAKALQKVPFEKFSNNFVFDQEMLVSAVFSRLRMGEIAIPVRYFPEASSISFTNSVIYGLSTLTVLVKFLLQTTGLSKYAIFRD